ncbi:hypothetical protein [Paenibacillus mucilaginosus]|uniref:Uncharacterized protein n=1 Tax=Paenibacillus mucilaginosus (strain KNP414) TaxID=1036673 RepID=F8FCW9_PAEMK|nr:hypothetical protein [Paenibacillus mucilaginosus]AEI39691.1 hypothetical protein KNP414_01123 [Paenibacillus mucilaginosus KNP414]MCG7218140.1 hypothetical protein [Paenibacillus mucilaginosus]WDM28991.1 hypothetical protein KCX80_07405 [Paenibacillus mucilaginosus]
MTLWVNFSLNEISILVLNTAAYLLILFLPKKLTPQVRTLSLMWGFTIGVIFDFTIGGGLVDFYMVNDTNHFEAFDFLYYFLFAPFGYFFFYGYEMVGINKKTFIPYVLAWSIVGVAAQWGFTLLEIITFQKGYKVPYSFPVFLVTQTLTGIYLECVKSRQPIMTAPKKGVHKYVLRRKHA